MDSVLFYIAPFAKNLAVLCLTVWLLLLARAVKSASVEGFSFQMWLHDNRQRFIIGFTFIFFLSVLMALTDVAPLFKVFGFDIDASPVGLGLSIGAMLMLTPGPQAETKKASKAKAIQKDAQSILKESAEIVKEEQKGE